MSNVLKSQRSLSPHQFKANYYKIDEKVNHIYNKISGRRKKFIYDNTLITFEKLNHYLTLLNERPRNEKKEVTIEHLKQTFKILDRTPDVLFPLLINCTGVRKNYIQLLEDDLNYEYKLLVGLANHIDKRIKMKNKEYHLFRYADIEGVIFLVKLRNLYRITQAKITHVPNSYTYILKRPIHDSILYAFYYAYKANQVFPDSEENVNKREELFRKSLSCMAIFERKLFDLFLSEHFADDIIEKFSKSIIEVNKLIKGVLRSDQKTLSKLKKADN